MRISAGEEDEESLSLSRRLLAASTGALLTALVVTPFDVVKTRMQATASTPLSTASTSELASCPRCGVWVLNNGLMEHTMSKYECSSLFSRPCGESSTLAMLGRIARVEGASGLYAGIGPTLVMAVPNTALYFTVYDELRRILSSRQLVDDRLAPAAAGSSARLVAATAVAPFELARTQIQAIPQNMRGSYFHELNSLVRTDGLAALWRGLAPTLWRDVPFSAIYWASYDRIGKAIAENRDMAGKNARLVKAFVSGLCAGAIAAIFTTPFDVVKTRRMVDRYVGNKSRQTTATAASSSATAAATTTAEYHLAKASTFEIVAHIASNEGFLALFSGALPRLLKVAPACAIMIGTYEYTKALFGCERDDTSPR